MTRNINEAITLEGGMDRQLAGENVEAKDLDVIVTITKTERGKIARVLSNKPLKGEERRRWWEHIREKVQKCKVEYSHNQEEYLFFRDKWRKGQKEKMKEYEETGSFKIFHDYYE